MANDVVVIISVYERDCAKYLALSIDSVLEQSYSCDLLIYQDGPVTKDLQDTINKYIRIERVRVLVGSQNIGLAGALNILISESLKSGYRFIARMDSDDICRKERIYKQISYFNKHPEVDVVGSFCREFGAGYSKEVKKLPTVHEDLALFSLVRCPFIHPSVVFRVRVFESGARYPTNTKLTEDMALWFDLLKKGFVFGNVPEVLLDYRLDEKTIERRLGIDKGFSEFSLRFENMIALRAYSLKNIILISARLFFHILPVSVVKLLYKYFR